MLADPKGEPPVMWKGASWCAGLLGEGNCSSLADSLLTPNTFPTFVTRKMEESVLITAEMSARHWKELHNHKKSSYPSKCQSHYF